ncbi:MAG: restriction endonuclease [Lachnospiraceae bacterium]|nr:restriction endonuclease [Lachnospiraceae bacterium]
MIKPDKITFKIAFYIFLMIIGFLMLILAIAGSKSKDAGFISICITTWVLFTAFCLYKIIRARHRRGFCRKGSYSLHELDVMDGIAFEHITCDILIANGFEHAETTQASWDFGVDVLATKDNIKYAIQCKRYSNPVGIEAVQQVYAGRAYYGCNVAVVFTNQYFTTSAQKLANKIGVVLWDRDMLHKLL